MSTATETKTITYHPGDWVEVANPNPENEALKGRRFEVIKATATRLTVYQNPARYDWERIEDEPIRPIYNLALAEVTPHRLDQPPSPGFHYAYGEMVMDDLNTENTNLASLRRYGIFAGYRDFPNMGRDYPPQPWIKWEDGTEGFTSEATLSTSPRPVYLREAPAVAVASDNNAPAINETPPESLTTAEHTPGFLSPNLADRLLEFNQGLDWQQNQFRIYGKEMPLPRLEIMFGDPGCTYRYGNVTLSPQPWPPELQALREQVEAATGQRYQVVIGNLYRSGADHIGYHADDSPEMGDNPAIASISLGATRRFDVRDEATREVHNYDLGSGDLVFMPAGFQGTHKHRIAKTAKDVGLRINWTFRPHVGGAAPAIAAEIVATDPGQRLTELEADITEGLGLVEQGKAKIWAAVAAVRSEELWQVAGHPSFEAYCEARWGWKKANAHENALAGEVLTGLLESGVPVEALPTSTSAMSQLAKADPGDRPAVLQKAADLNGGRVTEAAVRKALKPEPLPAEDLTDDEAAALGLTVYRPDTSDEAIAEGLAVGYIVPTDEQPHSPADSAHAAASPAAAIQSSAEAPAPVLEALRGVLEPGRFVRVADRPGAWYVAQHSPAGGRIMVWSGAGKYLAHPDELTPGGYCDPAKLEEIAQTWLHELASVFGAERVQALLGEVA